MSVNAPHWLYFYLIYLSNIVNCRRCKHLRNIRQQSSRSLKLFSLKINYFDIWISFSLTLNKSHESTWLAFWFKINDLIHKCYRRQCVSDFRILPSIYARYVASYTAWHIIQTSFVIQDVHLVDASQSIHHSTSPTVQTPGLCRNECEWFTIHKQSIENYLRRSIDKTKGKTQQTINFHILWISKIISCIYWLDFSYDSS